MQERKKRGGGSGQVRSGQVRSGQVRSGQVRSGQVRSGQVRSPCKGVRGGPVVCDFDLYPYACGFESGLGHSA